jgi:hypothetical protein
MTTGRNADAGLTFLRHSGIPHLHIIFQYTARKTPSAVVCGRARCITFELFTSCSLDMLYMGILFSATNTSIIDVQGVCLSTSSSMEVQGVCLSTASSMEVQGVCLSTTMHQQYGSEGCMPFHSQQYGSAGCMPFNHHAPAV